ncbi:MAG: extracellular solute-binding protein [Bacilli bacterium]|nr:extracellular solute-binding protein [Bacilli bacterium]
MKRKILGSAFTGALLVLASCGGTTTSTSTSTPASTASSVAESGADGKTVAVKVWVAENIVNLTKTQLAEVKASLEAEMNDGTTIEYTVSPVGEGDAAGNMITDVESGADIYGFAQDQLARLYTAGALTEVSGAAAEKIEDENDSGAIRAASFGGKVVAYPMTSDNGYFLYYDKSIFSADDIDTWTEVLAKAEAANKYVYFNGSSAWYNFGFFYGGGADSVWTTNAAGKFTAHDDTYATKGLAGAKGLLEVVTNKMYVDGSAASAFAGKGKDKDDKEIELPYACAVVSGTWDYTAAKEALGDNLGAAALPSFTVDGKSYHTGSFSGNKLIGVKPSKDSLKASICQRTAQYLTAEKAQLERFNAVAWGPSNKAAAANEAVAANPALVALAAQNEYAKPQGQFPGAWWDTAGSIGTSLKDLGAAATDDQIKNVLNLYDAALDGMLDK